jgi:hypothetical protein
MSTKAIGRQDRVGALGIRQDRSREMLHNAEEDLQDVQGRVDRAGHGARDGHWGRGLHWEGMKDMWV